MTGVHPGEQARRLAAESLAREDPTGWFERLYAAADTGQAVVPWAQEAPDPMFVHWAQASELAGNGRRALVVGCGFGDDAEYVAGLAFDTVAFDIAPTAIRVARHRYPDSRVRYVAADLLDPPAHWLYAFDLVVESFTVQALPDPQRRRAIANVGRLVGAGGTLIVHAYAGRPAQPPRPGPPWPLTRAEVESFAADGLTTLGIDEVSDPDQPSARHWRAEFRRPDHL